uniref:hypothetical protein n=1 Tax=Candidatus Scatocola faecigallinarum TaxID=2840916 RepID=UPI0040271CA1
MSDNLRVYQSSRYSPDLIYSGDISPAAEDFPELYNIYCNKGRNAGSERYWEVFQKNQDLCDVYQKFFVAFDDHPNVLDIHESGIVGYTFEALSEEKEYIINKFQQLKNKSENHAYLCRRLDVLLSDDEEEDENAFSLLSFEQLYQFVQYPDFDKLDVSLQIDSSGQACLQKTFHDSYMFLKFRDDGSVFYRIVSVASGSILCEKGTFDDFFRDIRKYPIGV